MQPHDHDEHAQIHGHEGTTSSNDHARRPGPNFVDEAEIDRRFDYHMPTSTKEPQHDAVRDQFKTTATVLAAMLPEGREKALAMTHLEEAMFWANAAIARAQ
jgi:hypothetical protein